MGMGKTPILGRSVGGKNKNNGEPPIMEVHLLGKTLAVFQPFGSSAEGGYLVR